jgi:hypothetical protein
VRETEVSAGDGRVLHVYDTGPRDDRLPVFWLHGTPMIGAPPAPLFRAAAENGVRWVSYDRPGNGGSSLLPGRDVGAVSMSGRAPYPADGLDWLAGMSAGSAAELDATLAGRDSLASLLASEDDDFDPEMFTPADHEALAGDWKCQHRGRPGARTGDGRPDRRRRGLGPAVGVRPGRDHGAGPAGARNGGPGDAERAQRMAGRPHRRQRRTGAGAGRGAHIGPTSHSGPALCRRATIQETAR